MYSKSKKVLAMSMALLMFATVFAGCSTKDSDKKKADTTSTQQTSDKKEVKLQLISERWSDANYAKLKDDPNNKDHIIVRTRAEVEKKYPEYKVNWEDWGWAEQLDQKQRINLMSGNAPDLVHGEFFMPGYANMDLLEPLPKDISDVCNPNMLLKNSKGEVVAIAASGSLFQLFYNKDVLKQAGLNPDTPIKTWDDFKKASDQITANGGGKVFGGGIPTHPHAGGALRAAPFIRMLGADFGEGSKVTLNTPEMIKALTYIREMDKNFPKGVGNNPDEGAIGNMFVTNKTLGFSINGSWQLGGWLGAKNNESSLGYSPLPIPAGGKDANCLVGFDYYGVPKLSKNKEAVFNVLRVMTSKELTVGHIKMIKAVGPNKEAYEDASVKADKFMSSFLDVMKNGNYKGLPVFTKNEAQIWDIIDSKVLARTTMTSDPIEKIVAEAQAECENLLK